MDIEPLGSLMQNNVAEHPRPEGTSFSMKTTESGTKKGPEAMAVKWV